MRSLKLVPPEPS
ncbi:Sec23/Sec24 protein transport family protein [Zea mays]|nr:Sec23/Sec24 protein transport family protein [Zea mays]